MQAAMEAAGGAATAAEAAATLRAAVENAREAGVNEMSSIMKKCTALLGAVELAAGGDFEAGMAALGDSPIRRRRTAAVRRRTRAPGTPAPPAAKTVTRCPSGRGGEHLCRRVLRRRDQLECRVPTPSFDVPTSRRVRSPIYTEDLQRVTPTL